MRCTRIAFCFAVLLMGSFASHVTAQDATPVAESGVTPIATGLTNPRGFTWGDDGTLYVALAGTGGEVSGTMDGAEDGIYGGPTSSVVTVENGCAAPLVEGIPSGNWRDAAWIWGAHDVAFLDGQLYVLSAGGGADFGNPDQPSGVLRVEKDDTTTVVADFSTWSLNNPPAFVSPDYNPSGSLFDMEAGSDRLWISDAVGGRIITVTPDGEITLVADISDGHPVPTGLAMAPDGGVYVGNLTAIPFTDGSAKVIHISPDGVVTDFWTGLTAINDIAIGPDGMLYAVEMATGNVAEPPFVNAGTGRVVRMAGPSLSAPVVTGIDFPTYIGFGSDGELYLTTPGFSPDDGVGHGSLLRIDLTVVVPIVVNPTTRDNGQTLLRNELAANTPVPLAGLEAKAPTCPDAGTPEA